MGQLETKQPKAGTVLAARSAAPLPSPRDPVAEAAQMVAGKAVVPNLWPSLQSTGEGQGWVCALLLTGCPPAMQPDCARTTLICVQQRTALVFLQGPKRPPSPRLPV